MTDRDTNERLLRLNAALDGELDAMGALEFEREMRDDPALAAEYRRLAALRDAVRRHAPRETAPQALRDRIAAMVPPGPSVAPLPMAAATIVPLRRRAWLDRRALALAASLGVLGFAVGAGLTSLRTPSGSNDVAQHLVSDFARAEIAGQPFDVASSDRHTVKPWFNGKVDFAPPVVDLASQGYPLAGGRLDYLHGRTVAALVFRRRQHVINLFVWRSSPGETLSGEAAQGGYDVVYWTRGGLEFWAVSDIDPKDLRAFAQAYRSAA